MVITRGLGITEYISSPQTGIIFTANSSPNVGDIIIFAISLQSSTATVITIIDSHGNTYAKLAGGHYVAGGISLEVWSCTVLYALPVYVTITFSASILCSVTVQDYVGSIGVGNVSTLTTGNDQHPTSADITLQDANNLIVGPISIFSQIYDVLWTYGGSYVCASSTGIYTGATSSIVDNTYKYIRTAMSVAARQSPAARPWMAFAVELRTGVKLYESQAQLIG